MNGSAGRIEIFAPFGGAIELTKKILFQPFDIAKWLVIGFAAFLAGLADGTRFGFPTNFNPGDLKGKTATRNLSAAQEEMMSWMVGGVIVTVVIVVVLMMLLFLWAGSRGRFMFIDCIVRNRGAIQEPWREFKRQGNSLFLFSLATMLVSLVLTAVLALPLLIPYFQTGEFGELGAGHIVYLFVAAGVFVLAGVAWATLVWFMTPVMYCRRCGALAALREVAKLVTSYPVPFLLYVLFSIVLAVAGAILSCVITCVTCCIASIPYIGTVVLLPLYTFYYAFTLLFLRQFGPEYDVWANIPSLTAAAPPEAPPTDPPPLQV